MKLFHKCTIAILEAGRMTKSWERSTVQLLMYLAALLMLILTSTAYAEVPDYSEYSHEQPRLLACLLPGDFAQCHPFDGDCHAVFHCLELE